MRAGNRDRELNSVGGGGVGGGGQGQKTEAPAKKQVSVAL